jgi:hypothetical protein
MTSSSKLCITFKRLAFSVCKLLHCRLNPFRSSQTIRSCFLSSFMMFADGFEVETESSDGGSGNRCLVLEIAHIYSGNVKHLPRKNSVDSQVIQKNWCRKYLLQNNIPFIFKRIWCIRESKLFLSFSMNKTIVFCRSFSASMSASRRFSSSSNLSSSSCFRVH